MTIEVDVISPPVRVTPPAAGRVLNAVRPAAGLVPFGAYTLLFLGLPTVAIVIGAFTAPTGGATLHNLDIATSGVYRKGFITSLELAAVTAVVPAILGLIIAYAVHTTPHGNLLRRMVTTASGVFANFGGVPLAFLFIGGPEPV
jgi:putative spermidine/putrescine transport system permease protein